MINALNTNVELGCLQTVFDKVAASAFLKILLMLKYITVSSLCDGEENISGKQREGENPKEVFEADYDIIPLSSPLPQTADISPEVGHTDHVPVGLQGRREAARGQPGGHQEGRHRGRDDGVHQEPHWGPGHCQQQGPSLRGRGGL